MKNPHALLIDLLQKEMELRNYSPRSIQTYCSLMSRVAERLGISLDAISTETFKTYLHQLITCEGLSVSTINQSISAFKILQEDVLKRKWEDFKIKRPRKTQKLPVILSLEEVERLISVTSNIKHRVILMLTYSAGLRKMEVLQLKPSAIDSKRMQVHVVQGKGKKDRYTILSPKVLEMLRLYYKTHRPATFLFEPQGRKGKPLSEGTLNNIVKKNAQRAGIKKPISFHTLRHCFATHLLEKGVNLRWIQQFMGHNSLKTTSGYLHLINTDLTCVVSPLDGMNI